ncbi:PBP1 and LysM peptidoglycan-binding domain-containing protein [Tamlana crocina]|uniref:LysM peptidoglycan-binding domain-containing protein n=1 Tax=Tamlana crocina TaxID=393006 RepID=A0ABX1DFJ2_9FLAO|nr:LysM peptidoglycan-binding domain-containing protein [Tamlana crocina]NJX16252.1 LysM peptidoglycan-binding domain-containing protein [Tamlana crocina]
MGRFLLAFFLVITCGLSSVNAQNFSTHKVKAGETIEEVSKKYFVSPYDIYELNPDAKNGLKANTILIIPLSKAKQPKVTVTKELQGFKEHKTKRKETLYSLAKEYGVTEDDIKKHNTFLYANPLRKGDRIQIPVYKTTEKVEVIEPTKTYVVKPKEGKWRIAYKFGISVNELEALNPGMAEVLKVGQEINVPNLASSEEKTVDEKYGYYKVLPKEGFYRLKLKLGLEQSDLEKLNPGLKETGLKEGMILKIPYTATTGNFSISEKVNLADSISDFSTKRLAVMLPFRLNRVDFDSVADTKRSIKNDPYLNTSLDFYTGVLMAVDSLKTLGVSLELDVYDTKNEMAEVSRIIRENDFENVDAVIGPLTSRNFERAASDLKRWHTPIVSPIGTDLRLYDNVFQARPNDKLLKAKAISFVKADSLVSNILIISDTKNTSVSNELKREFARAKQIFSRKDKDGKEAFFVTRDDILSALKPGKNIVFLETENEGFAANVTSVLASLIRKGNDEEEARKIVLVTTHLNSAFEGDQINNTHLSKLQFHFATGSKAYNENDHRLFLKQYVDTYKITPNNKAVKGFDLTMDVVLRLVSSGDLYLSVKNAPLTEYIENKFAYKKELMGGYYNDSVYLVKYDNLSIVEVKQ